MPSQPKKAAAKAEQAAPPAIAAATDQQQAAVLEADLPKFDGPLTAISPLGDPTFNGVQQPKEKPYFGSMSEHLGDQPTPGDASPAVLCMFFNDR